MLNLMSVSCYLGPLGHCLNIRLDIAQTRYFHTPQDPREVNSESETIKVCIVDFKIHCAGRINKSRSGNNVRGRIP